MTEYKLCKRCKLVFATSEYPKCPQCGAKGHEVESLQEGVSYDDGRGRRRK